MSGLAQKIFQQYLYAGALTHNPDAVAALFTPDGVIEAPLVPAGQAYPRRMVGRDEIRAGLTELYKQPPVTDLPPDLERSKYQLHVTDDPDVFIAELDTVLGSGDQSMTMSLVWIFRLQDGLIASLRDYFSPNEVN